MLIANINFSPWTLKDTHAIMKPNSIKKLI